MNPVSKLSILGILLIFVLWDCKTKNTADVNFNTAAISDDALKIFFDYRQNPDGLDGLWRQDDLNENEILKRKLLQNYSTADTAQVNNISRQMKFSNAYLKITGKNIRFLKLNRYGEPQRDFKGFIVSSASKENYKVKLGILDYDFRLVMKEGKAVELIIETEFIKNQKYLRVTETPASLWQEIKVEREKMKQKKRSRVEY